MAAGFKQATVNASDVPATQTNFPAYVDLSRLGITTLAEAQSVRCYSDSGKTTELVREIVSATQMHVKVPSLTSAFVLYVDYDGVRADYAVTDTYGRNAVWSDYRAVYHLNETVNTTSGGYKDSTGNYDATGVSMALTEVTGKLNGKAQDFDGTNDYIDLPILGALSNYRVSYWVKSDDVTTDQNVVSADSSGFDDSLLSGFTPETNAISTNDRIAAIHQNSSDSSRTIVTDTVTLANATWYKVVVEYDGTTMTLFTGGTSRSTASKSGLSISNVDKWNIGQTQSTTVRRLNGQCQEVRISATAKSANWETTEWNNQDDEAGFWGTWTDAAASRKGAILAFF